MSQMKMNGEELAFGLDIGTRSVIGTIGYKQGEQFVVVAQEIREHQTRAMLDGQIHDINRVAATIESIKLALQEKTGLNLEEVCIAAAGRVLKTMNVHADLDFEKERNVTKDDMDMVVSLGVEKAFSEFQRENDTDMRFYCVGYSVVKYYLNGMWMSQPEHHKAKNIGADIIATYLPDGVVDGLYSAVELAGLKVVNLTLEPIAAIRVAIPEKFRLLNIAMVDVGAGTSDISITNEGSVVAFGMLPHAGDMMTEALARSCLIDFATAEKLKTEATVLKEITYEDIMGVEQKITAEEVVAICQPEIDKIAKLTAKAIVDLNGGVSPSAVFIVGGGGKIKGYSEKIAAELGLDPKRVALRGEEILKDVEFPEGSRIDSTIVTPIGICLSYYEQNSSFIYITFNGDRIKLYDNNKLAVVDAAMQASFGRERLFPRRGKELHYTVNSMNRVKKGEYGESARIYVNGEAVDLSYRIKANDVIVIEESTAGKPAEEKIANLVDYNGKITLIVNDVEYHLSKPVKVNGVVKTPEYMIQEGDAVSLYSYYTYDELIECMGYSLDDAVLIINGVKVSRNAVVYGNDRVEIKGEQKLESEKADMEETESAQETFHETAEKNIDKKEDESTDETVAQKDEDVISEAGTHSETKEAAVPQTEQDTVEQETVTQDLEEQEAVQQGTTAQETPIQKQVGKEVTEQKTATQEHIELKSIEHAVNRTKPEKDDVFKTMIENAEKEEKGGTDETKKIIVIVNQEPIVMKGKKTYMFVDIFDYIDFDTSKMRGAGIVTLVNGKDAQYTQQLYNGDKIEVYWKEAK